MILTTLPFYLTAQSNVQRTSYLWKKHIPTWPFESITPVDNGSIFILSKGEKSLLINNYQGIRKNWSIQVYSNNKVSGIAGSCFSYTNVVANEKYVSIAVLIRNKTKKNISAHLLTFDIKTKALVKKEKFFEILEKEYKGSWSFDIQSSENNQFHVVKLENYSNGEISNGTEISFGKKTYYNQYSPVRYILCDQNFEILDNRELEVKKGKQATFRNFIVNNQGQVAAWEFFGSEFRVILSDKDKSIEKKINLGKTITSKASTVLQFRGSNLLFSVAAKKTLQVIELDPKLNIKSKWSLDFDKRMFQSKIPNGEFSGKLKEANWGEFSIRSVLDTEGELIFYLEEMSEFIAGTVHILSTTYNGKLNWFQSIKKHNVTSFDLGYKPSFWRMIGETLHIGYPAASKLKYQKLDVSNGNITAPKTVYDQRPKYLASSLSSFAENGDLYFVYSNIPYKQNVNYLHFIEVSDLVK